MHTKIELLDFVGDLCLMMGIPQTACGGRTGPPMDSVVPSLAYMCFSLSMVTVLLIPKWFSRWPFLEIYIFFVFFMYFLCFFVTFFVIFAYTCPEIEKMMTKKHKNTWKTFEFTWFWFCLWKGSGNINIILYCDVCVHCAHKNNTFKNQCDISLDFLQTKPY